MSIDAEKLKAALDMLDGESSASVRVVCEAARAHLATLPKTKEVEVWRTEYAANGVPSIINWYTREAAEGWAEGAKGLAYIDCIRVTGPHKQRIRA